MGPFWGICARPSAPDGVGGTGPEYLCSVLIILPPHVRAAVRPSLDKQGLLDMIG